MDSDSKGVMLLQMVPDNSESGAIYLFDRLREQWYMLSFEGCEDQFTLKQFDSVFSEYNLFRLVEQPGLLLTEPRRRFQRDCSPNPRI